MRPIHPNRPKQSGSGSRRRARERSGRLRLMGAAFSSLVALGAYGSASAAGAASSRTSTAALPVVTVGIGPFLDNQTLALAQQLGFTKEEGFQFKFETLASNDAIFQAIEAGHIDMGAGTMRGLVPLAATAPNLRNFIIRDQFLGNFVIGRKSENLPLYSQLVKSGESASAARLAVLKSWLGKSIDIIAIQNLPPITSALESVGLNPSLLKVNNFSSDADASLAFEHGEGDFYTGNLVTQAQLLIDHPREYVDLGGGTQVLGEAGLSYDAWTSSQQWLSANHALALKVVAVDLKVARYIQQNLAAAAPELTTMTNDAASSNLTVSVVKALSSKYETFLTPADLANRVFNSSSPSYWMNEERLDVAANKSVLPVDGFKASVFDPAEQYFREYLADPALVKFVDGPLP